MPLKHLSENLSMLVVTVPSVLMEADPSLPCKEANAMGKQYGEGGGNAFI